MGYGVYTDQLKKTASDKVLREKALATDSNLKYQGHQQGLISMVWQYSDKRLELVL